MADPAAIFSGDDIQSQVQARFDVPILTIGLKHLLGTHLGRRTGAQEVFGFEALSGMAPAIDAAGESGGHLRKLSAVVHPLPDRHRAGPPMRRATRPAQRIKVSASPPAVSISKACLGSCDKQDCHRAAEDHLTFSK